MVYQRPTTIEEALSALGRADGPAIPLAGGTGLLPKWSTGAIPRPQSILDLKHIKELRGISRVTDQLRLGACTLLSEIESDPLIRASAPVLADAAARIGCLQIRNRGTVGGNLCHASPCADTAVPLILLDAALDLASMGNGGVTIRQVPIADFFRGPGSTVLEPGEILTQIRFRPLGEDVFAAWDKFGTRPAMEIAIASVGLAVKIDVGAVTHARVGYGSVAPIPLRGRRAEETLVGNPLTANVIEQCEAAAREEITPITDVRASEAYRREVVGVMIRRMLERANRSQQG